MELSRRAYVAIYFLSSKFPGHFAPGSESSIEQIGQGAVGRFAPESELARERKGCESISLSNRWLHIMTQIHILFVLYKGFDKIQ